MLVAIPLAASVGLGLVGTQRSGQAWTDRSPRTYPMATLTSVVASNQPIPPREVKLSVVTGTTLKGVDGAIYLAAGLLFLVGGAFFTIMAPKILAIDLGFLAAGLLCLWLLAYRIVSASRVLRSGVATLVEVTEASTRRSRLEGTPWGDMVGGTAARGKYRDPTRAQAGTYYLQQGWALTLKPGDHMWVIRAESGPTLYGPA